VTGEWIGFAAVIGPVVLLGVFFWFRFRARREMQDTIRVALDKGQELSPEIIDRLGHPRAPKKQDIRLGVIWIAVAVGIALLGIAIPEEEATRPLLGFAGFPFVIGVAYLILNKVAKRDD
jgi:Na+/proline symporter